MKLLLAEDEKDLREALKVILEKNNFSVDAVADGIKAVDYIKYNKEYDCIILDIMMPNMDGIEVIKYLRENNYNIPILVLSAKAEVDDKVLGLDLGANDYLVKPFNSAELLARIRVLTRKSDEINTSTITLANITLNRVNYSIQCENNILTLPNKEFQILEILMSQPNNVISSDILFNKVWGYDSESDTSTIWTTLSNLRKKLSSINSNVNIKSVRNVGYTLEIIND